MRDTVQIAGDIGNDVSLHDLLVINIEDHLYQRMVHLADDFKPFHGRPQIIALMVDKRVQRLKHDGYAAILKNRGGLPQRFDDVLMLLFPRRAGIRADLRDQPLHAQSTRGGAAFPQVVEPCGTEGFVRHAEFGRTHAEQFHAVFRAGAADGFRVQFFPVIGFRGVKPEGAHAANGFGKIHLPEKAGDRNAKAHGGTLLWQGQSFSSAGSMVTRYVVKTGSVR